MTTTYHLLSPKGDFLGAAQDNAEGLVQFIEDNILAKLDDHAAYSVAVYKPSAVMPGKSMLVSQVSAEEFRKQFRELFT